MTLLSLLVTAFAIPVAAAICLGVRAFVRSLGYRPAAERITAADRRWLAAQAKTSRD